MRVRVLGSLTVLGPNGWVSPAASKRRKVLAVLALEPDQVVANDRIAHAVWGDEPPASAVKVVQNHVLALRHDFGAALVVSHPGGYSLDPSAATDASCFDALARRGSDALRAGEPGDALAALDEARALWRGDPFSDLEGWDPAVPVIARLHELARGVEENHLDARLRLGGHLDAVADLEVAVASEPLRERRWELLVLALYRSGRQAEALRAFQRARAQLLDELGVEPGVGLRALDRAVATQDQTLQLGPDPSEAARPDVAARAREGASERLAGDPKYRVTLHEAARLARASGDDDALVAAALAGVRYAGARSSGSVDEELVELVEAAVDRAHDDASRARLLSALAQELAPSTDVARCERLCERALALARRTRDASVLSEVLGRRCVTLDAPARLEVRGLASEENVRLAVHTEDPIIRWAAVFTRLAVVTEMGDGAEVDRWIHELARVTDELDAPPGRWGLLLSEAWYHLLRGRLGAAERAALEAYLYGRDHAQPDAIAVYGGQLLTIRREQGRVLELQPTILAMLDQPAANAATRPMIAEALTDLGRPDDAARMLREELESNIASAPGRYWLTSVSAWATVARRVDAGPAVAHLRDLLEPYVEMVCFNGAWVVGSVALVHGELCLALGERRKAEESLHTALLIHKQLGAPLLVDRTEKALARLRS